MAEWELWDKIIEDTSIIDPDTGALVESGHRKWGDLAFQAFEDEAYIEFFYIKPKKVSARQWAFIKAVRAERNRHQEQRIYLQNQQAKNTHT